MDTLDIAVIGAGAVGLAVAARLTRPELKVAVFERHRRHGLETSSRSSEVVHGGFYYPPGSLKATLCVAGRRRIYELAERHGIYARSVGKLVVAESQAGRAKLEALLAQGLANGVEGLELVEGGALATLTRGVCATAALWSPQTGIMDTEELMRLFLAFAEEQGAMVVCDSTLEGVDRVSGGYRLRFKGLDEPVMARRVVNAAGLFADRVAALAGVDVEAAGYRLHWFKGEYFSLARTLPPRCLVYPLPGPHGLGIHLTLDRQGRQRLGPNAFPVDTINYEVDGSHADAFYEAARRALPDLRRSDLLPGTAGLRPKLSADGSFRDFVIAEESARGLPGWVNLIGIESPGLTASPAIADFVADLLGWNA